MIKIIRKAETNTPTIELPNDMVGKTIEILAFPIDILEAQSKEIDSTRLGTSELEDKLSKYAINSGGYKFNRNEANNYE